MSLVPPWNYPWHVKASQKRKGSSSSHQFSGATVDGSEIPKNHLGCIYKTVWIMGWTTTNLIWLAGFLNHQHYGRIVPVLGGKMFVWGIWPSFSSTTFRWKQSWLSLGVFRSAGRSVSRRPKWKLRLSKVWDPQTTQFGWYHSGNFYENTSTTQVGFFHVWYQEKTKNHSYSTIEI